jgi:hypothetical protein
MPLVSNGFSNSGPGAPEPARAPADDVENVEQDVEQQPSDEETA